MKKVYIVEDSELDAEQIKKCVKKYSQEEGVPCEIKHFSDGQAFLEQYDGQCDVVFADIQMPYMNGLTAMKKLRLMDPGVGVIFVTNLAQYAIEGYEVSALDFIVKPVTYTTFKQKLKKAFRHSDAINGKFIFIDDGYTAKKIRLLDIVYIEKEHNYAVYHTLDGEFRQRTTLAEIEKQLSDPSISKCSSGCLANYRHVKSYTNTTINVGIATLSISRGRQKPFLDGLIKYYGEV